jgi:arylsulfatase A-like enzyme
MKRPNILYIITDEQHANAMSNTGNPYLKTPGMDDIASHGVRFEKAYCTHPVCSPSRASMFTGKMPSEVLGIGGVRGLTESIRKREMGWLFRNAGYETAYAGKWHLPGGTMEEGHGFDILCGTNDELATKKSIEFLQKKHSSPFLLVSSLWQPHGCCPYHRYADPRTCKNLGLEQYGQSSKGPDDDSFDWPEDTFDAAFIDKCPPMPDNFEPSDDESEIVSKKRAETRTIDPRPYFWVDGEDWNAARNWTEAEFRYYMWAYYRLVERADGQILRIINALKESGEYENTLIVFTSDHGDMVGAHRLTAKGYSYEECCRIPFIMSYPGQISEGEQVSDLVSNGLDLIPTLCDFADIESPQGLTGRSLREIVSGGKPSSWREDLFIEIGGARLLHTGQYKYTRYHSGERSEQLYDLAKDPGETKNLAELPEYQEIKKSLREKLEKKESELDNK